MKNYKVVTINKNLIKWFNQDMSSMYPMESLEEITNDAK